MSDESDEERPSRTGPSETSDPSEPANAAEPTDNDGRGGASGSTACAVDFDGDDTGGAVPAEELGFDPVEPDRPVLVWDGTCGFCKRSLEYIRDRAGDALHSVPYQKVHVHYDHLSESDFARAVHLIEPGGRTTSGAEAVYRALSYAPGGGWTAGLYAHVPPFAAVSEAGYRFVAEHRPFVDKVTRWLIDDDLRRSRFQWVRWLFIRLLGVVFLVAFLSLWSQLGGLVGSQGIAPAAEFLEGLRGAHSSSGGSVSFFRAPTLFWWIAPTDGALAWTALAGGLLSIALVAGVWPRLLLPILWAFYLSFCTVSGPFLGYQWDILLLEVAFLGFLIAPAGRWTLRSAPPVDRMPLFLMQWLAFRLMFMSGIAKLGSGDPTWIDGTALTYHFWTQPLPTWTAYWVHWMPDVLLRAGTVATLIVEFFIPFLVFAPRRLKRWAGYAFIGLQLLIVSTGNYTFFNILTIGVCMFLVDDSVWRALVPARLANVVDTARERSTGVWERTRRWLVVGAGAVVLFVTTVQLERSFPSDLDFRAFGATDGIERQLDDVGAILRSTDDVAVDALEWLPLGEDVRRLASSFVDATRPFRTFNTYGLFADMTTSRPEIIVQGSRDGETWKSYNFRWKPDALAEHPSFVQPHQPRLDWQMWFQALRLERYNEARGGCGYSKWFVQFQRRLLEGSRPVLDLLARAPFEGDPPTFVRTIIYDYRFTRPGRGGENWWRRSNRRRYCPPLRLVNGELRAVREQ